MPEKKAQIILEVAQAIGTQLEMSDLLAALNNTLKPIVHFDAISILILKGKTVTPYGVHVGVPAASARKCTIRTHLEA
jgi:transcriptional regulator with GAF, ATPase, and Fis domain